MTESLVCMFGVVRLKLNGLVTLKEKSYTWHETEVWWLSFFSLQKSCKTVLSHAKLLDLSGLWPIIRELFFMFIRMYPRISSTVNKMNFDYVFC